MIYEVAILKISA